MRYTKNWIWNTKRSREFNEFFYADNDIIFFLYSSQSLWDEIIILPHVSLVRSSSDRYEIIDSTISSFAFQSPLNFNFFPSAPWLPCYRVDRRFRDLFDKLCPLEKIAEKRWGETSMEESIVTKWSSRGHKWKSSYTVGKQGPTDR